MRVLCVIGFACWMTAQAGQSARSDLHLSAGLQQLFRQEMGALLEGTQRIAAALPAANWSEIGATSTAMQHSYVLEKKLTREQQEELARLPAEFQRLDEAFHVRAGKLERAAREQDARSVVFQFSQLLEACTTCHAQFAKTRFPAFSVPQNSHQAH